MVSFFCRACRCPSSRPVCEICKKPIPSNSVCNVWEDTRASIADRTKVGFVFRTSLYAMLILFLLLLVLEFINNTQAEAALSVFLTKSGMMPALIQAYFVLVAAGLLLLFLQGEETAQYLVEPKGILKRTWIKPTRLKCWSRFIRYNEQAIRSNAQGLPFLLAHEEYLLFTDAARYSQHKHGGRVSLYRPYSFLFMNLQIPPTDYDEAVSMMASKMKNKATR